MPMNVQDLIARVDALPACAAAQADWFMDIDGVLNIQGAKRSPWGKHMYSSALMNGLAFPLMYSPDLNRVLEALHEKNIVRFRWLTTWGYDAPIASRAMHLHIGAWIAGEDLTPDYRGRETWWKLDVVVEHLAGGPEELTIWTDDEIGDYRVAQQVVDFLHPHRAIVVCTEEEAGLTPENFDFILTGIERRIEQLSVDADGTARAR